MKPASINYENSGLLSLQRFLYFFQVLAVGVVIPFLYLYGTSTKDMRKTKDTIVKEISSDTHPAPANVYHYTGREM